MVCNLLCIRRMPSLASLLPALALVTGCAAPLSEDDAEESEGALSFVPPPAYREGQRHSTMTREVVAKLRAVHARSPGRDTSFIKVGDSITYSESFMTCLASKSVAATHPALESTRTFFESTSFARRSRASTVGWHTWQPLRGNPAPVDVEIGSLKPSFAIVMLGTNDTYAGSESAYETNLGELVDHLLDRGVVPILSTIPQRAKAAANAIVPRMNLVVRKVASERLVPLMDYHLALADAPSFGLSTDGVHPRASRRGACDFSSEGLEAGYNERNLLALEALERVRRFVLDEAAPEGDD